MNTYTGVDDCFGVSVHVGDIVKFVYRRDMSEPDVGFFDHEGTPFTAYGEVRMSPYLGVYLVHHGSCYRLRKKMPLQVIDRDQITDPKEWTYRPAEEAYDELAS